MTAPNKILIPSDSNEMTLIRMIKGKTEILYEYQFTKSDTKEGMKMTMTEEQLTAYLRKGILQ